MAKETDGAGNRKRMLVSVGWAAGIGISLVEMQFGMEYVLSLIAAQLGFVVNCLPAVSVLARHIWG
jgi:hypothetical protein